MTPFVGAFFSGFPAHFTTGTVRGIGLYVEFEFLESLAPP
jgi:hypothetical protein